MTDSCSVLMVTRALAATAGLATNDTAKCKQWGNGWDVIDHICLGHTVSLVDRALLADCVLAINDAVWLRHTTYVQLWEPGNFWKTCSYW